jgi:outer membrane immunogenic protein
MTRRIIILAAIAVFALLPVGAAAEPISYSWTGFYAGIQGLYGVGNTDWDYTNWYGPGSRNNHSTYGVMGGVFGGYNYQFKNNIVIGAELEGNGGKISGNKQDNEGWDCRSHINWIASARGRVGYVLFDYYMPYVTGGGAYGGIDVYDQAPGANETFGGMKGHFGWTAGAGIEYAVSKRFRIKAEYSYYDFGSDSRKLDGYLGTNYKVQVHTGKIGVSYTF